MAIYSSHSVIEGSESYDGVVKIEVEDNVGLSVSISPSADRYVLLEDLKPGDGNYAVHVDIEGYDSDDHRVVIADSKKVWGGDSYHLLVATSKKKTNYGMRVTFNIKAGGFRLAKSKRKGLNSRFNAPFANVWVQINEVSRADSGRSMSSSGGGLTYADPIDFQEGMKLAEEIYSKAKPVMRRLKGVRD